MWSIDKLSKNNVNAPLSPILIHFNKYSMLLI